MDEDSARRLCSLIAGVLCADGAMAATERAFLKRVMTQCGLDTDTGVMAMYGVDLADEMAQLAEGERWQALALVIEAAVADGEVHPAERAWVDAVAHHLGAAPEDVETRIAQALAARN
ncbi:MAG: TerB family tellurite resistance protein [Myxococcota bacterium]